MFHYPDLVRCDGCGAEIFLAPLSKGEHIFCCEECAAGRPCPCAERQDRDNERRTSSTDSSFETGLPA